MIMPIQLVSIEEQLYEKILAIVEMAQTSVRS